MFGIFNNWFGSSNDSMNTSVVGDSNAVLEAVMQRSGNNNRYIVTFGEPRLVDYGGEYSQEYKVEVPTETQPGAPDSPDVVYNLPDGEMSEVSDSGLYQLLNAFDIDVLADLGDLEGKTIPGVLSDGAFSYDFSSLVE